MNKHLQDALRLLANTPWYLFQLQASGFPRELCGSDCEGHRDDGSGAMEDCDCLYCHAGYAATRDPERLTRMWEEYPHGLLAVRTGLKSNLVVIDADIHEGGANGLASLATIWKDGWLPESPRSQTGGGGQHWFYEHPGEHRLMKSSHGKLAPGIDVKGENSYVILPPSTKAAKDTAYTWFGGYAPWQQATAQLHPAISDLLGEDNRVDLRSIDVFDVDFAPMALDAMEEALLKVKYAGTGERNGRLFQAACRAGEAVYGGALKHSEALDRLHEAGREILSEHETKKTVRSGLRTGMADAERGYIRDVR